MPRALVVFVGRGGGESEGGRELFLHAPAAGLPPSFLVWGSCFPLIIVNNLIITAIECVTVNDRKVVTRDTDLPTSGLCSDGDVGRSAGLRPG